MTYNSIENKLDEYEAAKLLVRFVPEMDPDESDVRDIYMPKDLHAWLYQDHPKKALNFAANIRGFLKQFVVGKPVDNCVYMKPGHSDVFWLRVQNQKEGERVRIFGCFACPDKFVAFFQKPRSWFDGHPERWDEAIAQALTDWNHHFSPRFPRFASPFSDCVTVGGFDHGPKEEA